MSNTKKEVLKKYFVRPDIVNLYVPKPGFQIEHNGRRISRIAADGRELTYIYMSMQFTDDSAVKNWDNAKDDEFKVFKLTEVTGEV